MTTELYHWQVPGKDKLVAILKQGQVAVNASDTGTGKTLVALQAAKELGLKPLVICPKGVITSWKRWAVELGVDLLDVANVEQIRIGNTPWAREGKWRFPKSGFIIWDEIHKGTAGRDTQTTQLLAMTKAYRIPVLAMSATVADSPLKLRGLGYLLGLHQFHPDSFRNWCITNGCYFDGGDLVFTKGREGTEFMSKIYTQIKDKLVRVRIAEVPEFPECDTQAVLHDLEDKYRDAINKIYEEMREELKAPMSDPMIIMLRARQRAELFKVPLLTDLTCEALKENRSVVLFVNFRDTVMQQVEALKLRGVENVSILLGAQAESNRTFMVDRFQDNSHHVCVSTIGAGGVGISLHDVHKVRPRISFITPSWSATETVQSLGRIHRAGGTKAVQQFVLISETIEETVYRAIQRKLGNIRALQDGDLNPLKE